MQRSGAAVGKFLTTVDAFLLELGDLDMILGVPWLQGFGKFSFDWEDMILGDGTSSYHSETDGQTEVVNRCLQAYLCCFALEQPHNWSYWVPWTVLWDNTTFHGSAGTTPFEIVYGRAPPTLARFSQRETRVEAAGQSWWIETRCCVNLRKGFVL